MAKPAFPTLLIHSSGESVRYVRGVPVLFELVSDRTREFEQESHDPHACGHFLPSNGL